MDRGGSIDKILQVIRVCIQSYEFLKDSSPLYKQDIFSQYMANIILWKNTDRILLKILSEMYRRTGKSYYSLEECHLDTDTDKIGFSEVCAFQVLLFILC